MSKDRLKYRDITDKELIDLKSLLLEMKAKLFNLKLRKTMSDLTNTSIIKLTKKEIAKICTAISVIKNRSN